jgi:hypothetical protein
MGFNDDEVYTIWVVDVICATISIVCCLFICITYCCYPSLRGYEFRLIFYLALSDILASIVYVIPPHDISEMCKLQGSFLTLTANLRLAFSAVIAHSIHVTYQSRGDLFKLHERKGLIFICLTCLILAILPATTDNYGPAEGICWITIHGDKYTAGSIWRMTMLYVPLWIVIVYNFAVYYQVIRQIKKLESITSCNLEYINQVINKLRMYPIILTFTWLPANINRIVAIFDPDHPSLILTCFSFGLLAGIGFFNVIAYGFTPAVRYVICRQCLKYSVTSEVYSSISI